MFFATWTLIIGVLLISMALSGTLLKRLPLSTALLYLAVGYGLGPAGLALIKIFREKPRPLGRGGIAGGAAVPLVGTV